MEIVRQVLLIFRGAVEVVREVIREQILPHAFSFFLVPVFGRVNLTRPHSVDEWPDVSSTSGLLFLCRRALEADTGWGWKPFGQVNRLFAARSRKGK